MTTINERPYKALAAAILGGCVGNISKYIVRKKLSGPPADLTKVNGRDEREDFIYLFPELYGFEGVYRDHLYSCKNICIYLGIDYKRMRERLFNDGSIISPPKLAKREPGANSRISYIAISPDGKHTTCTSVINAARTAQCSPNTVRNLTKSGGTSRHGWRFKRAPAHVGRGRKRRIKVTRADGSVVYIDSLREASEELKISRARVDYGLKKSRWIDGKYLLEYGD